MVPTLAAVVLSVLGAILTVLTILEKLRYYHARQSVVEQLLAHVITLLEEIRDTLKRWS
jgi:hypothetical protein